jgi:serine/threonine-protein kinase RsbW
VSLVREDVLAEKMLIPSELSAAGQVEERLLKAAERHGYDDSAAFAIRLALEEGLMNAIRHGNRSDPSKDVEIEFDIDRRRAIIVITDQGDGFDPSDLPDPTADENLEKPTGRGIMLMRAYMDDVRFNAKGNQVRLMRRNR